MGPVLADQVPSKFTQQAVCLVFLLGITMSAILLGFAIAKHTGACSQTSTITQVFQSGDSIYWQLLIHAPLDVVVIVCILVTVLPNARFGNMKVHKSLFLLNVIFFAAAITSSIVMCTVAGIDGRWTAGIVLGWAGGAAMAAAMVQVALAGLHQTN
ncbi:hypothetical protein BX600DRAFT_511451 [Xylariales sp. PMI_506]|nr:hypothetical protein BX600DRAFT_511451 [Xylariales sp. PMI_506]